MSGDQVFINVANDIFSGGGLIAGFVAVIYGAYAVGMAAFQAYDITQGRHDAPTWRAVGTKLFVGSILMAFATFATQVSQSVGGGQSATTYAALSFSGGAPTGGASLSASLIAVFQVLQVMGIFSELRGLVAWHDLVEHKTNTSIWRPCGYIFGGGCLVHLSLIVTLLDGVMGTGFFS